MRVMGRSEEWTLLIRTRGDDDFLVDQATASQFRDIAL
jgi:hypothetical protein